MGTKIEGGAFLREHPSVIDLDGRKSNGMRSLYHENQIPRSKEDCDSFTPYDLEKVRQTILEHELVFKRQLQELHRLYGRQRELMSEIRRRDMGRNDVKVEKCQSSYLFSPNVREDAKRPWNPYHSSSIAGCLLTSGSSVSHFPTTQDKSSLRSFEPRIFNGTCNLGIPVDVCSRNMEKQAPYNRDSRFSLSSVQTSQHKAGALTFDLNLLRNHNPAEMRISNQTNGVSDRLTLSRSEMAADSCSSFNLVTKDFFQNSLDRKNGENSSIILGLSGARSGKEQSSDDYAEKMRLNKHTSVGDFCSGKPPAFPHSLPAEPRKQFSNRPLDIGASVFRKRKKIFGVEISEDDDQVDVASNKSSKFDQKSHDESHSIISLEPSSWIDNSFLQNLGLRGSNSNDGKTEGINADFTGTISRQQSFSGTRGKWTSGCSPIGLNLVEESNQHNESYPEVYFNNADKVKMTAEVMKDADCQNKQDNPKGGIPWFLRNTLVSDDQSKEKKSSYFMNLDSLQNCSQRFFGKAELANGTIQTLKQTPIAEGGIDRVIDGSSAKKILGFPISEVLLGRNLSKVEEQRGLNISDLRHCIDLNMSLDEEDVPSLPTAVVKIATTEIDLEAPAVMESETEASPNANEAMESDISQGKSEGEECDRIAAEAMITISLSRKKSEDDDSLKWFADIVSSHHRDSPNEVLMNRNVGRDEEEDESIPDNMDYFEFMTLKLEDNGEKHHKYEPLLNNQSDDEAGTKRSRRGQSRRGRQRKDFQRDVLPGVITLSRLEVKEDFQAFEELLKAGGGGTWPATRTGRAKKRWGRANVPPRIKKVCSREAICQLEERGLAGWGKRTRRLPRQRCPAALLSFPVKC